MIFLFVIDTGAAMNQMTCQGMTLLDCAKAAVEHLVKLRTPQQRNDRYFLVTCEEGFIGIKSAWKTPIPIFMNELKNLSATSMSTIGPALKTSFDLLNLYRLQNSVDTYGMGRYPWISEPSLIVLLTSGNLNSNEGVVKSLTLPLQPHQPGHELTKEPFRWDQRLITISLRFPAYANAAVLNQYASSAAIGLQNPPILPCPENAEPTALMSKVTGGKCYQIHSMKELYQLIEQINNNFAKEPVVVVNFEKFDPKSMKSEENGGGGGEGGDAMEGVKMDRGDEEMEESGDGSGMEEEMPKQAFHVSIPRCINNNTAGGTWPIPEGYLLTDQHQQHAINQSQSKLRARSAQPVIKFYSFFPPVPLTFPFTNSKSCNSILKGFLVDKYQIERCELTDWLLKYKRGFPYLCFIPGSSISGKIEPFGFIKASKKRNQVNMVILAYNFPRLLPLLEELVSLYKSSPPPLKWKQEFENYLNSVPFYYIPPLRKAFKAFGINVNLIPSELDGNLPYSVTAYMKQLKSLSKTESNRWQQQQIISDSSLSSKSSTSSLLSQKSKLATPSGSFHSSLGSSPSQPVNNPASFKKSLNQLFDLSQMPSDDLDFQSSSSSAVSNPAPSLPIEFKNVFDIQRNQLIDQIQKMRVHVFVKDNFVIDEAKHALPIGLMGNYQEALTKREYLRDLNDDDDLKKRPIFGNPYGNDKRPKFSTNLIDEDEDKYKTDKSVSKQQQRPKQSSLISTYFSDSVDTNEKPNSQVNVNNKDAKDQKAPPASSAPVIRAQTLKVETLVDKNVEFEGNLTGIELYKANQAIREANIQLQHQVIKLFRGRCPDLTEENVSQKLSSLKGNKATKKFFAEGILEKAFRYKKSENILHVIKNYIAACDS